MKYKTANKNKLHWTHLLAVIVLGGYFLISKANITYAFLKDNPIDSFLQLFLFGLTFTFIFLYIFSHEKFFPFAKEIEKKESKKEKNYLNKYLHHGKMLATFLIGLIGGPVFLSLTIRILLNTMKQKYLFAAITSFVSSVFTFAVAKGLITLVS